MRQRVLGLFVVLILLYVNECHAQYFQFSQYNFTSQRVNPAMLGLSRYAAIDLDYRNQKTGGDFAINSGFASVSYPLLNASTGRAWSGIGLSALTDQSAGVFNTQEVSAGYAVNVPVARRQLLSLGVKALYQSQQINYNSFYTGMQYIPDHGFDQSLFNGENLATLRKSFHTFSMGAYWQQTDKKDNVIAYWGISLFDLNQPTSSFLGNTFTQPSTWVLQGGAEVYQNQQLSIIPEVLFTHTASNNVLNGGARFRYDMNNNPRQTSDKVDIIAKYVVGRSGILGLQLHKANVSFGVSYDFPVLTRNPGNTGALEVGLEIRKLVIPPSRKRNVKKTTTRSGVASKKPIVKKTTPPIQKRGKDTTTVVAKNSATEVPNQLKEPSHDSTKVTTGASAGNVRQEPLLIEKVTLHFNFEYNSAEVDDESEKFIDDLVHSLRDNPELKIKITGHTDNVGGEKFNQKLSLKRANAVRDYLISQGIDTTRIATEGMGMSNPITTNDTAEGRAQNRRVELLIFEQ